MRAGAAFSHYLKRLGGRTVSEALRELSISNITTHRACVGWHQRARMSTSPNIATHMQAAKACEGLTPLNLHRVLIVSKLSRYEFERRRNPRLDEKKLKELLSSRGSIYDGLKTRHDTHNAYVEDIRTTLTAAGSSVKVVSVMDVDQDDVDDADVIISAGGDGTFLSTAAMVYSKHVPVIGINTDAARSEGHMCVRFPDGSAPLSFATIWQQLKGGRYEYFCRQRIRVRLHIPGTRDWTIIPRRALNDVNFCETDSTLPIYYQLVVGDEVEKEDLGERDGERQKASGVLVCTGTGSTAWNMSSNKMFPENASTLLSILADQLKARGKIQSAHDITPENVDIHSLTSTYNQRFVFPPDDPRLHFTVREPIENGIFQAHSRTGYVSRLLIKSRSPSGRFVMDGVNLYQWADGAVAEVSTHPDDCLLTLRLT